MRYTVYFQIYGKKMKATVVANSKEHAVTIVRNKLVIDKVEDELDFFKKIFRWP